MILGHIAIGLKQLRVANATKYPSMKFHLLSLSKLADRK